MAVAALTLALAAGCSSGSGDQATSSPGGLTTVTVALDYLPGAAHDGLAYAVQQGLFKDAGIKVDLVPYGATSSDVLTASGKADFGITFGAGTALTDFAAGLPVTSVFVIYAHNPADLAVLKSSGITRPAELAGKTYGGFGTSTEIAAVNTMVQTDGGAGPMKEVTLNVGAYQALEAGRVNAVLAYPDDDYVLRQHGKPVTTFDPTAFGVPDGYGANVLANSRFLQQHQAVARAFVGALQRGYEMALKSPDVANADLQKQFPGEIDAAEVSFVSKINHASLYLGPSGVMGKSDPGQWQKYADWMIKKKILVDANGDPVTSLDVSHFVSNDYLAQQ